jgi:hypothetical protein
MPRLVYGALALSVVLNAFLLLRPAPPSAPSPVALAVFTPSPPSAAGGAVFTEPAGTDVALIAQLHIATLHGGSIVPAGTTRLWLELGSNNFFTLRDTHLDAPGFEGVFAVSFEPLLDKYAAMIASNKHLYPISKTDLGRYHERGLILPLAIAEVDAPAALTLHVSLIDGCASLAELDAAMIAKCGGAPPEPRVVPAFSLARALELTGLREVEFTKIDIQGLDLAAVRSAGAHVRLLRRVLLEVAFAGAPHCRDIVAGMAALGFRLGSADEAAPYVKLEGAYGNPLVYAGGPTTCETTSAKEGDAFFVAVQ